MVKKEEDFPLLKVYNVSLTRKASNLNSNKKEEIAVCRQERGTLLMNSLNSMASINNISFTGKEPSFEIGLSEEELTKRTHKDYLSVKKMLAVGAPEFEALAKGDKKALAHLVKAAYILAPVYMMQDDENNIAFRNFLKKQAGAGDKSAKMALKLFNAQKGMNAVDTESIKFSLMKGGAEKLGKAFYPSDLGVEEFHNILISMLEKGKTEKVKTILNQRSVVKRAGAELTATDFTEVFGKEFKTAAKELEKAAKVSTNPDFAEFLKLQAKALVANNPMADAFADKKWAELQDTPLEFTITRENYEDELTGTVVENKKLNALLEKHGIVATPKDSLGFRVGIVNKEGTEKLLEIKKYLPALAKEMPFADRYVQNISSNLDEAVNQTMVDVDLVAVTGDVGAFRGGITLAENLPNDDKLSLTIGGGRRNVYHRQIRAVSDMKKLQQRLDATLDKSLHPFFENEADHWFTIGHENAHSLGPNSGTEALGKYQSIIEENKADMTSVAMLNKLEELGMYTSHQKKQILTTFVSDLALKAKPNLSQAHRVRTVMQMHYLTQHGAVNIDENGIIHINYEKVIPTARKMLEEIIEVQLSKDFAKGEKFVLGNFVWSEGMEKLAQSLKKISKTLNGRVVDKLARHLLKAKI